MHLDIGASFLKLLTSLMSISAEADNNTARRFNAQYLELWRNRFTGKHMHYALIWLRGIMTFGRTIDRHEAADYYSRY